jgi:hypothetical protein
MVKRCLRLAAAYLVSSYAHSGDKFGHDNDYGDDVGKFERIQVVFKVIKVMNISRTAFVDMDNGQLIYSTTSINVYANPPPFDLGRVRTLQLLQ